MAVQAALDRHIVTSSKNRMERLSFSSEVTHQRHITKEITVKFRNLFAGAALIVPVQLFAQSGVSISGAIDLGVVRLNDQYEIRTSTAGRSNLTFSGVEDLGEGFSAFFHLQHRYRPDDGAVNVTGNTATSAPYFWRQSWVGLRSTRFGDARVGRMLMPLQDVNGTYDPFELAGVGSIHTGGLNASNRVPNAVVYRSPVTVGFQFLAGFVLAEEQIAGECGGCAPLGTKHGKGLALTYTNGSLRGAIAWDANTAGQKTAGLYAGYTTTFAQFMAQFERGDRNPGVQRGSDLNRWSVSVKAPINSFVMKAGYTEWPDEDVRKFGAGMDYLLSKRTSLYTNIGKYGGSGNLTAATGIAGTNDQIKKTRFDLGILHRF